MSDRYDSRALLADNIVPLNATGNVVTFNRDGLILYAKSGATTTAVSCPTWANLPIGLTFIADNSNASGSMTLTPTSGTSHVITSGKVYRCMICAAGTVKATELAAGPT